MSTSRRELLTMGGAGVAALAFPSFLPSSSTLALAQTSIIADPILTEIGRQFLRINTGLHANPPRGNAQQIAATFRMLSAWGRARYITGEVKRTIEDAIAVQGHNDLVSRLAAFDRVADNKARGIPMLPSYSNLTHEQIARSIGMVRGGAKLDVQWRNIARHLELTAERFNRILMVRNGGNGDGTIRRIQDGGGMSTGCDDCDGDGVPDSEQQQPDADCTYNGDGSMTCYFTDPNIVPDAPVTVTDPYGDPCSIASQQWGALFEFAMYWICIIQPEVCLFAGAAIAFWDWHQASYGC